MTDRQEHVLTWQGVERVLQNFAFGVQDGYFKQILCVSRGGLALGGLLGYLLDVRLIGTICVAGYEGRMQSSILKVEYLPDGGMWNSPYTLIVDDIADTGRTMQTVGAVYPEAVSYCLVGKPVGHPFVNHWSIEVSQDTWVVFPWEVKKRPHLSSLHEEPAGPQ